MREKTKQENQVKGAVCPECHTVGVRMDKKNIETDIDKKGYICIKRVLLICMNPKCEAEFWWYPKRKRRGCTIGHVERRHDSPDLLTASKEEGVGCPNCKQGTMEDHGEAGTFCNLCNWEKGMVFFDPSKSKEDRGEK